MSTTLQHLASYLSDTATRSGQAIGDELGCSRAAVWKHVQGLRSLGVEIDAVAGQGYRLREPLELLDEASILAGLGRRARAALAGLQVAASLDSTNTALQQLPLAAQHAAVILAEHQRAGRGRRGRQWHSPFGRNLYLSLGWRFESALSELGCVSLVVALATAKALSRAGLSGHCVKWPNDLLLDGRKLCGCLVEVQGDAQGPCHAVVGVGVNVHMPASAAAGAIDQPWTDLETHLPGCSRNRLASLVVEEMLDHLEQFSARGFSPFAPDWRRMDGLQGQEVTVVLGPRSLRGTAAGIDQRGALLLDTGAELLHLHAGEVSLSPAGAQEPAGKPGAV